MRTFCPGKKRSKIEESQNNSKIAEATGSIEKSNPYEESSVQNERSPNYIDSENNRRKIE